VAKKLIELQNGRIGCRSEPGRGAEFWFALPVYGPPAAPDEGKEPGPVESPESGNPC
jgi:hypothetical protein